jgi:hypothetical protein
VIESSTQPHRTQTSEWSANGNAQTPSSHTGSSSGSGSHSGFGSHFASSSSWDSHSGSNGDGRQASRPSTDDGAVPLWGRHSAQRAASTVSPAFAGTSRRLDLRV